jgi:hypothetical protein
MSTKRSLIRTAPVPVLWDGWPAVSALAILSGWAAVLTPACQTRWMRLIRAASALILGVGIVAGCGSTGQRPLNVGASSELGTSVVDTGPSIPTTDALPASPPPPGTYPVSLTSAESDSANSIIESDPRSHSTLAAVGLAQVPLSNVRVEPLADADGTYLDVSLPTPYSGTLTLPLPDYAKTDPTNHLPSAAPRTCDYRNLRIVRFIVDLRHQALVAIDPYETDGVAIP